MTPSAFILRGGLVFDGYGNPPQANDVVVSGDRIAALTDPGQTPAGYTIDEIIDVSGRWVCPGFIDTHTHSDTYLLLEPDSPSKIMQGVTTEVIGNCGSSAAPLHGIRRLPSDWQEKRYPMDWSSLADYRACLQAIPCAVNVVALIGHNTLRASVMGNAARIARPDEIRAMASLLRASLDEGAWGWSTGLLYTPGKWAAADELRALAAVVADAGGIYSTHLRNEGDAMLDALDEALDLARHTGVKLQISHLKVTGNADTDTARTVQDRLHRARQAGYSVAADKYPYNASCTDLDVVLPDAAIREGPARTLEILRSPTARADLIKTLTDSRPPDYWERITLGSCFHADTHGFQGMPLTAIAEHLNLSPVDALLRLIERDELKTSAFFFNMPDAPNRQLFSDETVMIGSDASLRAPWGVLGREFPHPRAYGSFPRFFRFAVDVLGWTPQRALHRMTGLPAAHFGLHQRGGLQPHYFADLVVMDPRRFADRATYANPQRFADGIDHLWINGTRVIRSGHRTGRRPGHWLTPHR